MKHLAIPARAGACLALAAVLAGCAGGPAGRPTGASAQRQAAREALDQAVRQIGAGTPSAIQEGIRLASAAETQGAEGAAATAAFGAILLRRLYPQAPGAGEGAGDSWKELPITSPFLQDLAPGLELLDPAARVDEERSVQLMRLLSAADALQPASPLPPFLTGLLMKRTSRPPGQRRSAFETALQRSPRFSPAADELIQAIIDAGQAPSELPRLQQLAQLLPEPADRFHALARADLAAGRPSEAADAAAQGLLYAANDSDRTRLMLVRAQAEEQAGDWYPALRVLDALLQLQPNLPEAILARARILHERAGNDSEALAVLSDAETRDPQNASFPELRARILLDDGRTDEAAEALRRANGIDPGRRSALGLLASVSAEAGRWKEAAAWLAQIPESDRSPEQVELQWRISTGLGDQPAALAAAQKLLVMTGGPRALAMEARTMITQGRDADARLVIDHALLAMNPPNPVASELHVLRARAGSEDPLSDLRKALMEDPDNVEALGAIAEVLAAQHDYRKAAEYARRAAALQPGNAALARKAAGFEEQAAAAP